jgi:hypothetical protein
MIDRRFRVKQDVSTPNVESQLDAISTGSRGEALLLWTIGTERDPASLMAAVRFSEARAFGAVESVSYPGGAAAEPGASLYLTTGAAAINPLTGIPVAVWLHRIPGQPGSSLQYAIRAPIN